MGVREFTEACRAAGVRHGAVRLAKLLRVSQLMIGLTVVAFGTSAPELFLDVTAATRGSVDLAFGRRSACRPGIPEHISDVGPQS